MLATKLVMRDIGKRTNVYMSFMGLEKAYDRVDRNAMWQVLQMYVGDGVFGRQ